MTQQPMRIWDNFIRLYHGSQLGLIGLLWYSAEQADFELHFQCGLALMALLLTRLVWGVIGSDTAKFSHFVKSPWQLIQSWRKHCAQQPHQGHNPVAGYMVIALMTTLAIQLVSGLFASDDVFAEGPLYAFANDDLSQFMDSLHASNINVLWLLIGLHALAGILHSLRGDHVIKAIISGYKSMPLHTQQQPLRFKSALLPLLLWMVLTPISIYFGLAYSSY